MNNLKIAVNAALKAGKAILDVYQNDFDVEVKADQSPLTEADKKSNKVIVDDLSTTDIPIISEEIKNMDYQERQNWQLCWMVDPLDGTKEFVKKNGEFTVNIALINNGLPILGVVYWPVADKLYFATEELGSFVAKVKPTETVEEINNLVAHSEVLTQAKQPEVFSIVASRSHLSEETLAFVDDCKKRYGKVNLVSKGSSLKLCMVAEGAAHVYPRLAPTMEWDTAAAHAVAKFSGCQVYDYTTKQELNYNKENLLNPYFVVLGKA